MQRVRAHVLICAGTGCVSSGSKKVEAKLQTEVAAKGLSEEIKIVKTGCHGLCQTGPIVVVYPGGTCYAS